MYEGSFRHLNEGGGLYVVTLKKHGAESAVKKLCQVFGNCGELYKKKGVYVLCCEKNAVLPVDSNFDDSAISIS